MCKYPNIGGIILAGGEVTRLQPLTQDCIPKPLYVVNHIPLIEYSLRDIGPYLHTLVFALRHHSHQIKSWIESFHHNSFDPVYLDPHESIRDAIERRIDLLNCEEFATCNADEIRIGQKLFERLYRFHHSHHALASTIVTLKDHLYRHRPWMVDEDGRIIRKRRTKEYLKLHPEEKGFVNIGLFMFNKKIKNYIDSTRNEWPSIIGPLLDAGQIRAMIDPNIRYFNVGTPKEANIAHQYFESISSHFKHT